MLNQELLTIDEVAMKMRVTRRAVEKWIAGGHLPVVKISGTTRVPASALRAKEYEHIRTGANSEPLPPS